MKSFTLYLLAVTLFCCSSVSSPKVTDSDRIHSEGKTLEDRILLPSGYSRISSDSTSFTTYLRNLKLKPDGSTVKLFSGIDKPWQHVHVAVIDMEIGKKDLQQCADACMRLRAEYLWKTKQFDKIHFNLTNGFKMEYSKWREGNRLQVDGNKTSWKMTGNASTSYESFRSYLDQVFMYAGTLSIEKELVEKSLNEILPGDVFVVGGSPGHAAMVADVAVNDSGEKIFLLAQGYMPAQEIHIIKNPNDETLSPWFSNQFSGALETMEWTFEKFKLGRFE